ncbi:MAG TPA: DNA alkylation repair protein [Candidatus Nanoarchaeia archaeon]|nr:DNA alkylation repair protein [Candidatus Nanoarchaeia archaeon]
MINKLKNELARFGNPEKAKILSGFFKTDKGQYGYGDIFLGVKVPETRSIAKKFNELSLKDLKELLYSKIHEERLCALLLLVDKYKQSNSKNKKIIVDFYIQNAKNVNNWDLVDLSADKILGNYLIDKDKSILYILAKSQNNWEKRISIISTFAFIRNNKFEDTIKISEILLNDKHHLVQKAVGWMLREVGKRDESKLIIFLDKHYKVMPRTMLRYAIERLNEERKERYMKKQTKKS